MNLQDIPNEVLWVYYIEKYVHYVGSDTYDKATEIIAKYPEYFPWETKYNSIPKEVHEAYIKEKYPDRDKPIPVGEGLIAEMKKSKVKYYNDYLGKSFDELWQDLLNIEQQIRVKEAERYKKAKKLWDKHYKKYNLEYRDE